MQRPRFRYFVFIFMMVVALALSGCSGDDGAVGPAGAAGADGADGAQGEQGPSGEMGKPTDTFFTLAVTDNSGGSHTGDNLLFMDFLGELEPGTPSADVVIAPEVDPGAIDVDGDISDWTAANLSTVNVINQSGTALAAHTVTVGAAYDDQYIYMVVQWTDATLNNYKSEWEYDLATDTWSVLGTGDGANEDRLFIGFPVVDNEGNFVDGGKGCAVSCHLAMSTDAKDHMGMNVDGDKLDMWHWKATRSAPALLAEDKHWILKGWTVGEPQNGRKLDDGRAAYVTNRYGKSEYGTLPLVAGDTPMYVPFNGPFIVGDTSTATRIASNDRVLWDYETLPYTTWVDAGGIPEDGDRVPGYIMRAPLGAAADVYTEAQYADGKWTVELVRLRNTGDSDDHQFVEEAAEPAVPSDITITPDATNGGTLYTDNLCSVCHGADGDTIAGYDIGGKGAGHILAAGLDNSASGQIRTMTEVLLTPQEAADIAEYLEDK